MTQSDEVDEGGEDSGAGGGGGGGEGGGDEIADMVEMADAGRRRWGRSRRPRRSPSGEPLYAGLGTRVENILRLAQAEAEALRKEAEDVRAAARAEAAEIIADAEREAARIRAEARADVTDGQIGPGAPGPGAGPGRSL